MLENKNEALLHAVPHYEAGITKSETQSEMLVQLAQQHETRIATLETQNHALMNLVKQSANEQVKITQSWAQVAAGAPAPTTSYLRHPGHDRLSPENQRSHERLCPTQSEDQWRTESTSGKEGRAL